MVTTFREKVLDFLDDFRAVVIMALLSPIAVFIWIISLIKGCSWNEAGWG